METISDGEVIDEASAEFFEVCVRETLERLRSLDREIVSLRIQGNTVDEIARFSRGGKDYFDDVSRVCITTIQRLYSVLKGEEGLDPDLEERSMDELTGVYETYKRTMRVTVRRSGDLLILEEQMKDASHDLRLCTDDGSYGHHGFVTDVMKDILEEGGIKQVVAIGPVPMMRAVSNITKNYDVELLVSLNPIMVDGTGMCGGCRVTVGGETKFACVDGPEFDGHQVDYDELMLRLQAYEEDEKKCHNDYCTIRDAK